MKTGAIITVLLLSVWHIGLNETKIIFTNFFSVESLAKLETVCVGDIDKNIGTCRKNINPEEGSFCAKRIDPSETIDCFATGQYE